MELDARYGAAYRPIAQFFGTGYVNTAPFGVPSAVSVGDIKTGTFESVFSATGAPGLMLDARTILAGGGDAVRLASPLLMMREVDEIYTRADDKAYYFPTVLPGDFDGLVWFAKSTPSALRP